MGKDSRSAAGEQPPEGEEPLVLSGHFEYSNRPRNDSIWTVLYIVFLALSVVGGVYGWNHRNHDFGALFSKDKLSDPATCPLHAPGPGRRLLAEQNSHGFPEFYMSFTTALLGTALLSLASGVAFLMAFRYNPMLMVRLTIVTQVAVPLAAAVWLLVQGMLWPGLVMLLMAALTGYTFYLWHDFFPLCARLLGVSAQGLNENPGVVVFTVVANIVMAAMVVPLMGFSGIALANGELIPNPEREARHECVNAQGQQVACCSWQADGWVAPFAAFNGITLLWTIFLVGQVQVFTVASSISQWYFLPMGSSTRGNTLRGIRHALGPSFGSLSFGAAILTLVQLIRNAVESMRQQAMQGGNRDIGQVVAAILCSIASCLVECFLQVVEFLTKFATVKMAISGEAFLDAAHSATDLLKRNFLKTFGVWWLPPMVLHSAAFLLSAVWGLVVFSLSWLGWHSKEQGTGAAIGMGVLAGLLAWAITSFFAGVLLSVVDAVYLCYAIDRDQQAVTKTEVHEVFSQVPVQAQGIVVDQPGGGLSYGAPQQQQQQEGRYVPPSSPSAMQRQGDSMSRV